MPLKTSPKCLLLHLGLVENWTSFYLSSSEASFALERRQISDWREWNNEDRGEYPPRPLLFHFRFSSSFRFRSYFLWRSLCEGGSQFLNYGRRRLVDSMTSGVSVNQKRLTKEYSELTNGRICEVLAKKQPRDANIKISLTIVAI